MKYIAFTYVFNSFRKTIQSEMVGIGEGFFKVAMFRGREVYSKINENKGFVDICHEQYKQPFVLPT